MKAENDRDYKPLIAIDSRVVIIDDAMKDMVQALFKATAKSKNGKKKDVNASSSSLSSSSSSSSPPPPPSSLQYCQYCNIAIRYWSTRVRIAIQ